MPRKPKSSSDHLPSRIQGKIIAFNVSPKGHIEGALVATEKGTKGTMKSTVQLNFPGPDGEDRPRDLRVGAAIDVIADFDRDDGDHPVYRAAPAQAETGGTITRLNYALHGEVNGWHLDDGTFVHVKPEGARKHRFRVGDRITVAGRRRHGVDATVVEAHAVGRAQDRPGRP